MKRIFRLVLLAVLALVLASFFWVLLYRFLNPPLTFLVARDHLRGEQVAWQWKPLPEIAPSLGRAVIAAEDSTFCQHHGFDLDAIERAYRANEDGGRLRGGSTISQQTAKNAFLWPGRTMARKAAEAWFTLLIERLWGKRRILEVYLNVAEFGRGVFGAEAAAQHYFHKPAARLSPQESARLAAILPQPIKRSASRPGPYTRRYSNRIHRRSELVQRYGLDSCIGK